MKKIFFLLSLCFAGLFPAQAALTDSIITYDINGDRVLMNVYEYDSLGRRTSDISYAWIGGVKVGKDYTKTTFDAQGRKDQETVYRWDVAQGKYIDSLRITHRYTGSYETYTEREAFNTTAGMYASTDLNTKDYSGSTLIRDEHFRMGEEDWVSYTKKTWAYEGSKNTLTQVDSFMEATGKQEIYSQTRKVYDAKGNTVLSVSLAWNETTHVTDSIYKLINLYNSDNKQILTESYDNKDGVWTGTNRTIWEYDDHKNQINKEDYNACIEGVWQGSGKQVNAYIYNGSTKYEILNEKYSTQTAGVWIGTSKTVKTYNAYFRNDTILAYTWDSKNKTWANSKWTIYAYDGSTSNKTLDMIYNWKSGAWVGSSKKEYVYLTGTSKQTNYLEYQWVDKSADWAYKTWVETSYFDTKGAKILNKATYSWVLAGSKWKGTSRTRNTYNASSQNDSIITYTWANDQWVNSKLQEYDYFKTKTSLDATYTWDATNVRWNGVARTRWTFDTANNNDSIITYNWSVDKWVNSTLTENGYTGTKLTTVATYEWINEAWFGTARTSNTYDAQSNLIKELTSVWKIDHWMDSTLIEHTWKSGVEVFTRTTDWNGLRWVMRTQYKHDIEKNAKGLTTLDLEANCAADSVWVGTTKKTWKYNDHGDELESASYTGDSIWWIGKDSVAKTYNEYYRNLSHRTFTWNKTTHVWDSVYWYEYAYWKPESDKKTLSQFCEWTSSGWLIKNKYEYAYDEAGRETMNAQYGTGGVGLTRTDKKYDANGNQTEKSSYSWSGNPGAWRISEMDEYKFDSKNRKIEYTHYYYSVITFDLVYDKREKYAFNEAGTKVMDNKYVWNGEDWLISVKNEAVYDADAEAKLRIKVDGSWNNGSLVKYDSVCYFYNTDPKLRTIIFKNWNDTVLEQQQLVDGETPVYGGAEPSKTATAAYTYQFKEWTPAIVAVSADAVYTATFDSTAIKYEVRFVNGETTLQTDSLAYGVMPEYKGATPEKAATAQYTYTFKAWEPEVVAVTADAVYTATFDSTAIKYEVRFVNGETTLQTDSLAYGVMPEYKGATPEKAATAQYTYTFKGWEPEVVAVTADAVYTATFDSAAVLYQVVFISEGDTLQKEMLEYGAMPEYKGATPEKAATAQYTYTFKAWEPEVVAVTADAVYTATFDSAAVLYQVVFISEGDTLQKEMLEYGAMPEYKGETPTKEPTVGYTYEFKGWTPDIVDVTEDATYTAEFTATPVVPTATEQVYEFDPTQTFYNLQGQIVDETYRGIVIQNGHRYILQ